MGLSSFSFSVVEFSQEHYGKEMVPIIKSLFYLSDGNLGARDIDLELLKYYQKQILKSNRIDISASPKLKLRLLKAI